MDELDVMDAAQVVVEGKVSRIRRALTELIDLLGDIGVELATIEVRAVTESVKEVAEAVAESGKAAEALADAWNAVEEALKTRAERARIAAETDVIRRGAGGGTGKGTTGAGDQGTGSLLVTRTSALELQRAIEEYREALRIAARAVQTGDADPKSLIKPHRDLDNARARLEEREREVASFSGGGDGPIDLSGLEESAQTAVLHLSRIATELLPTNTENTGRTADVLEGFREFIQNTITEQALAVTVPIERQTPPPNRNLLPGPEPLPLAPINPPRVEFLGPGGRHGKRGGDSLPPRPRHDSGSATDGEDGIESEKKKFKATEQAVVGSLGRMAEAAILGSEKMSTAVIGSITNILQSIPSIGGGLFGGLIGIAGGLLVKAFSKKEKTVPVKLEDLSSAAERKMKDKPSGPEKFTVIIESNGRPIEQIEHELRNRQRRDAIVRFPRGVNL